MPLQIVRNDITKMNVDAIVNAANESLLGGGGVDGCIHRAAGPELLAECETLHGCETGSAKITKGYKLPCKYVIHAVGPRWYDGRHGERELLISCYQTSLMIAKEYGCESVAFPLISSGIFGYPKDQALKVAIDTISSFLLENEMTVYIVIFDRKAYQISGKLFADIASYIDDRYVDEHTDSRSERLRRMSAFRMEEPMPCESSVCDEAIEKLTAPMAVSSEKAATLDDALGQIDESFSEMLLRKIDERGMTDAQCYKKANIDRKLFSKIRSDKSYKPSKPTVIAFAIALELPLVEMKDMSGLEADTIGGFNSMIEKQKKENGEALISTVLFDNVSEVIHDRVPVQRVEPMTDRDYSVRGCTALLDAIGGAIHHIGNVHKYARNEDVPEHTLFVITTDGMENASRRYDSEAVKKMIERQKEKYSWEFLFLGANIDAVETAKHFGIGADRAVNYHSDHEGTQLNYEVLSEAVSAVRCSVPLGTNWKKRIDEDFNSRKDGRKQ